VGACGGELLELRGGLECSDLDYLKSALDGKRGALEIQPTKHVRTHTHKLKLFKHITVVPHLLERHAHRRCKSSCCKKQNSRNQVLTGFEPPTPGHDPKVTPNESGCLTSH